MPASAASDRPGPAVAAPASAPPPPPAVARALAAPPADAPPAARAASPEAAPAAASAAKPALPAARTAAAPASRRSAAPASSVERLAAPPAAVDVVSVDPPAELTQALDQALRDSRIRWAQFRDPRGAIERLWWVEERAKVLLARYPDSPRLREAVVAARTYRSHLPPTPPPPTLRDIDQASVAASFLLRRGDVELARERAAWASACADHLARHYVETDDLRWLRGRAHTLLERTEPAGSRPTGVRLEDPGTPCM
jgi:hypothetical protein